MARKVRDIESIFHEAGRIGDARSRAAYLKEACDENAVLAQRIEKLVAARSEMGDFLEGGSTARSSGRTDDPTSSPSRVQPIHMHPGSVVGRYKLVERLGEGGFGVVFLAEQEEPVRRQVALKVIKLGMDTEQVMARFEAERQALAILDRNTSAVCNAGWG